MTAGWTWIFTSEQDDNDTLLVSCEAFPEIATFAENADGLYLSALGALEEAVAARLADGRPIPPSAENLNEVGLAPDGTGKFWMKLPRLLRDKVELAQALKELGLSRADLTRMLGWKRESVDRLFRPDHMTRHRQFDEVFRRLGRDADPSLKQPPSPAA